MTETDHVRILFIINPGSGKKDTDWVEIINAYFASTHYTIELFTLPKDCDIRIIKEKIEEFLPQKVVAVGGDGTIKMVAECLLKTKMPLGILPAGSANGLAKELSIPQQPKEALDLIIKGELKMIHATMVNDHLCIHLSDIGFNAYLIKKFESQNERGMWGYLKASLKILFSHALMDVEMNIDNKRIGIKAAMIVIANGTQYGSSAIINPVGRIDDSLFEVIAVKKISLSEIYKMTVSHSPFDRKKTAVYQTNNLMIRSRKKVHFQVDGEYLGKVYEIKADLLVEALEIIVPLVKK